MSYLDLLDWKLVRKQYMYRKGIHEKLLKLCKEGSKSAFAKLALGISDEAGNYSANDHSLGPMILSENREGAKRVLDLASHFLELTNARRVPQVIKDADLHYLKIGIGSELSCMMNPKVCWVTNTRTIWTHLIIKHDDIDKANEELRLYRDNDDTSEMAYLKWTHIHYELSASMTKLAKAGSEIAESKGIKPGMKAFLWADSISTILYDQHN